MKALCEALAQSLKDWSALESPAFLHGMLTGALCGSKKTLNVSDFVKLLLEELEARSVRERFLQQLHELYTLTRSGLESPTCDLKLCLPEAPLQQRAEAVGQWSEGFAYGFGMTRGQDETLSEDVREYLEAVTAISGIETASLSEAGEEAEAQLEELTEFLRIGAIAVYETLHPADRPTSETGSGKAAGDGMPPPRTTTLQ